MRTDNQDAGGTARPIAPPPPENNVHAFPVIRPDLSQPIRLGVFFSHPTQHHSVMFQRLSERPESCVKIYYYDAGSLRRMFDPGYGNAESWDVDLLSGTDSRVLFNPIRGRQVNPLRQLNPAIVFAMWQEKFHAVFVSGYVSPSNWLVLACAWMFGAHILYQSDSNILDEQRKRQPLLKRVLRGAFFRGVGTFLLSGDKNKETYVSYGQGSKPMVWCPIPVDVKRYESVRADPETAQVCRELREHYQIPTGARVAVYCGKLIARKRPQDLIEAIRRLNRDDAYALLIGSGPEEAALRAFLKPTDHVRITGFVNQSMMPYNMLLGDVGVTCSEWDPHPLVVTEFAACGLPIVTSHYCGLWGEHDILRPDENGFVYPCGEVEALAGHLGRLFDDTGLRERMGVRSMELARTQSAEYAARAIEERLVELFGVSAPDGMRKISR